VFSTYRYCRLRMKHRTQRRPEEHRTAHELPLRRLGRRIAMSRGRRRDTLPLCGNSSASRILRRIVAAAIFPEGELTPDGKLYYAQTTSARCAMLSRPRWQPRLSFDTTPTDPPDRGSRDRSATSACLRADADCI